MRYGGNCECDIGATNNRTTKTASNAAINIAIHCQWDKEKKITLRLPIHGGIHGWIQGKLERWIQYT